MVGETSPIVEFGGFLPLPASYLSFPVRLSAALDEAHSKYIPQGGSNANCDDGVLPAPSATNPEADPGYLCVFGHSAGDELDLIIAKFDAENGGTETTGTLLFSQVAGTIYGSYATTG
jgi:hypothetical protein